MEQLAEALGSPEPAAALTEAEGQPYGPMDIRFVTHLRNSKSQTKPRNCCIYCISNFGFLALQVIATLQLFSPEPPSQVLVRVALVARFI